MDLDFINKELKQELKRLLEEWRKEVGKIDKSLLPLVDKFIKANEGGKRVRGKLVVLGYELGKSTTDYLPADATHQALQAGRLPASQRGEPTTAISEDGRRKTEDILKIAAAYEIFHTAILAHDDIIDKSLLRRNQPSLYQALGGDHKGISLAITLADAGFFLAIRVISESNFPDKEKIEALRWFSKTMLEISMGQILDIQKGDSLTVAKYKTAKYTVSGPLVLGAILGKSHLGGESVRWNKAHLRGELEKFGENLGIAFQIQDDILDSEIDWLGGVNSAKKEAERYKNQALKILPEITKDPKMSKILEQLAENLVQRTK